MLRDVLKIQVDSSMRFQRVAGGGVGLDVSFTSEIFCQEDLPFKYIYHATFNQGTSASNMRRGEIEVSNDTDKISLPIHKVMGADGYVYGNNSTELTVIDPAGGTTQFRYGFDPRVAVTTSDTNFPFAKMMLSVYVPSAGAYDNKWVTPFLIVGAWKNIKMIYDVNTGNAARYFAGALCVLESATRL